MLFDLLEIIESTGFAEATLLPATSAIDVAGSKLVQRSSRLIT